MPLRDFTEAEIVLKARRRMEQPLLLMVWLGVTIFSLWQDNMWYLVAGTLAVGINLLAVRRAKEVYVHRMFVNVGVGIATTLLLMELALGGGALLGKLGNYLVLIQLCKLFERKGNRDYVQMIALNLLLVISGALLCHEMWFAGLLVVYAWLACYVGMVFTLKRNLDRAAVAKLVTESGPLSPKKVAWNVIRDWPTGALLRGTAGAMAAVLAISVVLFLISPRGLVDDRISRGGGPAVSGFSTSGDPGRAGQVYQSDRVAMTVTPVRVGRTRGPLYLRGRTFRHYAGSLTWEDPSPPRLERRKQRALPGALAKGATVLECSLEMGTLPSTSVFVPSGTVYVECSQAQCALDYDGTAELTAMHSPSHHLRYTTWSLPKPRSEDEQAYVATVRARRSTRRSPRALWQAAFQMLGLPTIPQPPRHYRPSRIPAEVRELAREWCRDMPETQPARGGDAGSDDDRAMAVARRLVERLGQHATYTLNLPARDPRRDVLVDFLFDHPQGHCEYFASALTAMCQAMGVPARLAKGFVVAGDLRVGQRLYVRYRDAHAWTEIRTSQGWQIVEATPPASTSEDRGFWAGLRAAWERLGFLWGEYVLGYDNEMRQALANWFGGIWHWIWSGTSHLAGQISEATITLFAADIVSRVLAWTALVVGAVAVAGLALLLVRTWWHARRHATVWSSASAPDMGFIQNLFDTLVAHGLVAREHLTPRQLAREAGRQMNLPTAPLDELVDLYYRVRWGRATAQTDELARAEQTVHDIRRRLAEGKSEAESEA